MDAARNPRDHIQSVARAFRILDAFGQGRSSLSLRQAADAAGIDRASARRYLLTLEDLGYVGRRDDHFHLRPTVVTLARHYLDANPVVAAAEGPIAALRDELHESCALTVLSPRAACFAVVHNAHEGLSIRLTLGNELPAWCTAMGRVLLGQLDDEAVRSVIGPKPLRQYTPRTINEPAAVMEQVALARAQGWAVADEELEIGVRSVAVPVRDYRQRIVASLSVTVPTSRVSIEALLDHHLPAAQRTAARINADS